MRRNVLVSQTRMPEFDRDRGSGRVDQLIRFLLDSGWNVTFLADEEQADARHARRLRQVGVAMFAGYRHASEVIEHGRFDLAVIAFWKQASTLIPMLRQQSPRTKIIIESIDLHFLREARRSFGLDGRLDDRYGMDVAAELNTYRSADAVLAVSAKETAMLADLIGDDRVAEVTLAESAERSAVPFDDRRGMVFVGNFRHLPNGEAVEYLCKDVLPRLDPKLLAAHPLTVVGNRLDDKIRRHAKGLAHVEMVGWVPSVTPYVERARVAVVPLLHGAGVKGKVVEAMMRGTPVVTTPIGAEGLGLTDGHDAFIGDDASTLASSLARLLVDRRTWESIREGAWQTIGQRSSVEDARTQFLTAVDRVLSRHGASGRELGFRHGRRRMDAYRSNIRSVGRVVESVTEPGSTVLVVSRGDDELLQFKGRTGWHFPRHDDGEWAGHHPADSEDAIAHLRTLCEQGARYLVLPSSAFWWLHHYEAFGVHLDDNHRRIHADADTIVFELRPGAPRRARPDGAEAEQRPRVLIAGTYDPALGGPSASLVAELHRSRLFAVTQHWEPTSPTARRLSDRFAPEVAGQAEWLVAVDAAADLPSGFLDDFLGWQGELGADRAQPAHRSGPAEAAPVTERLKGCVARTVSHWTPVPVRSVRAGAALDGPVALLDVTPIGLAHALPSPSIAEVLDVQVAGPYGIESVVTRSGDAAAPRISVVVATYERPALLEACLEGFCAQTIDRDDFEVVVVDDGSEDPATGQVIERFTARLPLTAARLGHAGRSAAKNLGIMLARGPIVLLFDDDDRPSPDLLEEHLAAHDAHPEERVAILGHTDWAPELDVTPLMHFLTDVDKLLFAYGNLRDGQRLDWRGFWEGRLSCKRALLMRHGLHDQRLVYSIDVEMAWRLAPQQLEVRYHAAARSYMARPIDLDQFSARIEAKGRAQAQIALLHDDPVIRSYTKVDSAADLWAAAAPTLASSLERVRELEAADLTADDRGELYRLYREVFAALYAKGVVEASGAIPAELPAMPPPPAVAEHGPAAGTAEPPPASPVATPRPAAPGVAARGHRPALVARADDRDWSAAPLLSVTIPVWSRTAELAEMAQRTIERIREVATIDTEIVVIDNGSPFVRPLRADVHRFDENQGVSVAWNAGIELARADVVAVVNSDCIVEPGWDAALYEAATERRRIAFPYTDHVDGEGFRCPDQAGTAGWCFMMTRAVFEEVGTFDERFSPAFGEDTDYWHRAWELGIELTPVPAARVTHARRTTGSTDPHVDWLLQAHRYKYGWKHGVDPLRAPPYYHRPVLEYVGRAAAT